jgi:ankyrin repeat protein
LDTVEYGADDDGKDKAKVSLHDAAEEGNIDTVESLLGRRMDIKARNASNQTLLDRAAAKGNVDVVRLLIERGRAEVDSRDMWGWTPLHEACRFGNAEVSRALVDHGANVNASQRNCCQWTPTHISAANRYLEIVKLLLERGADTHAINCEGETPYQDIVAKWKAGDCRSSTPEVYPGGQARRKGSFYDLNALSDCS